MLSTLICRVTKHRVNRRRVWDDGVSFRTHCERCGQELLRGPDTWRAYDPVGDENPQRQPHPTGH